MNLERAQHFVIRHHAHDRWNIFKSSSDLANGILHFAVEIVHLLPLFSMVYFATTHSIVCNSSSARNTSRCARPKSIE